MLRSISLYDIGICNLCFTLPCSVVLSEVKPDMEEAKLKEEEAKEEKEEEGPRDLREPEQTLDKVQINLSAPHL